jgi:hypothetical protein
MNRLLQTRIGMPFTFGALLILSGCDKEKADPAPAQNESAMDAANQKKATLQFVQLQHSDLKARMETTKAGVAKLGNKTRKKLKPKLAALDSRETVLDGMIQALPTLKDPEFQSFVANINAALDSANADLAEIKKHLK